MTRKFIRPGLWAVGRYRIKRTQNGLSKVAFLIMQTGAIFGSLRDAELECQRLMEAA